MKMGWRIWQKSKTCGNFGLFDYAILVRPFYLLSITILSLLLPLSFLLLARLSSARYLFSLASNDPPNNSYIFSVFLYTNSILLHALVSIVSLATLIHALTGQINPLNPLRESVFQPRVHVAWIFLCTLQVLVGLGIETTMKAGVDGSGFSDHGRSMLLLSKLVFFVGLHETMIHWSRTIVRPVVDDTVFGGSRVEQRVERWALAAGYGALSWWRLRNEVESLVVVVEVKRDMNMMMEVGLGDFLGWWLYYSTVAIGFARLVKGIMWFVGVSFCRSLDEEDYSIQISENEDKV